MKLFVLFIILTIFLIIISKFIQSHSKERFTEFSEEELEVVNKPFNSKSNPIYMRILQKFNLPVSPLDKNNYCDVLSVFGKFCDVNLTYTNK